MKSIFIQRLSGHKNDIDPVRFSTPPSVNQAIDEAMQHCIEAYAHQSQAQISARIKTLQREWDVERVLETNASILSLTGLALGAKVDRKWLILPGVVLSFLLQHAIQGWCPPLPLIRALGVRTRREIDTETSVLKFLRGDFDTACQLESPQERAQAALKALRGDMA